MIPVVLLVIITTIFSVIAGSLIQRAQLPIAGKNEVVVGLLTIAFWWATVKLLHLHPDLAFASHIGARGSALVGLLTLVIPVALIPSFTGRRKG